MGLHTASALLGVLLLVVNAGSRVLGFSSATTQPPRIPSARSVATIDAAELFDGSFFGNSIESDERSIAVANDNVSGNVRSTADTSAGILVERVTSSSLAWATIGAVLSLSTALNTHAVGASLRLLRSVCSWYMVRLAVAPLVTKCITGGLVALLGDYGAQWFEHSKRRSNAATSSNEIAFTLRAGANTAAPTPFSMRGAYDRRRGLARFLECFLISTPIMHLGYDAFESILPVGGAGIYRAFAALTHVLADSLFLDGIFVFTGILATGLLEGHSLRRHVLPNLRNIYFPTLKASVMTSGALMPIEFLSFLFLPVQLRVLSVNFVDLIWNAVVSFVSHSGDVEASCS